MQVNASLTNDLPLRGRCVSRVKASPSISSLQHGFCRYESREMLEALQATILNAIQADR